MNPHASKRETTDENFIYVLCHRARAVTAALNLISELVTKLVNTSSIHLLSIDTSPSENTIEPPLFTTNYALETEDLNPDMSQDVPRSSTTDNSTNNPPAKQDIRKENTNKRSPDDGEEDQSQRKRSNDSEPKD